MSYHGEVDLDILAKRIVRNMIVKGFHAKCVGCNATGMQVKDADGVRTPASLVLGSVSPEMWICLACDGLGTPLGHRNIGEQIALVHSELSELLELARVEGGLMKPDKHCPDYSSGEIEVADVIIRMLDLAACRGFDVMGAIEAKMTFNESREPMHGKLF